MIILKYICQYQTLIMADSVNVPLPQLLFVRCQNIVTWQL